MSPEPETEAGCGPCCVLEVRVRRVSPCWLLPASARDVRACASAGEKKAETFLINYFRQKVNTKKIPTLFLLPYILYHTVHRVQS